jgi:hypothetical protein
MTKITLDTQFIPYSLDSYNLFTFDSEIDCILENEKKDYDDFDWNYDNTGYLKALAENLIKLLNDNILDNVIISLSSDLNVISPKEYNFSTDRIFIDFNVNLFALKDHIKANQADYDANKLKDGPGFMWFGDDNQTMLNYYLRTVSAKNYEFESYYYNQLEQVPADEFISYEPVKQ